MLDQGLAGQQNRPWLEFAVQLLVSACRIGQNDTLPTVKAPFGVLLCSRCIVLVSVERIRWTKSPSRHSKSPQCLSCSSPRTHLSTPQPWHPRLQRLLPSPAWRCQRCVWDFSKSCKKLGSSFSFCMSLSAAKNFCPGTGNLVLSRAVGSRQ